MSNISIGLVVRIPACHLKTVRRWPGFDSPIESILFLFVSFPPFRSGSKSKSIQTIRTKRV
ncbi:uncharacterized protein F4822DRAFT_402099 [Hypoxylon trugodes]|uniref:uncharacterized protein n=1 Tax=Hypoxylon trugodes TaxID=326681 RepID=UPI002195143E|nr:uncharacterized protein F4822DRAFT_402099 [Hypoxylon trugodes]KAI1388198.1 hypothetical protein F4822DRAFT_402099 [Hypoxylon trugodes]